MSKLILSLDGGGIRGAAATQFLTKIEKELTSKHNTSIRDCVDFYAGTSTGSIIALALSTTDMTMEQINDLYNHKTAEKIFAENKGLFEINGINAPRYESKGKTKVLQANLGDARLSDVPVNKHVLAVTYGVERRKPEVIKTTQKEHLNLFSYQVADASSAAPTYFPTKELGIKDDTTNDYYWLIDGGVTANNPTMCAIAEARKVWKDVPIEELRVLSIGTGYRTRKINGPASKKWGAIQWFTDGHILDLLADERVVAYQTLTITNPGKCIRVNAELRAQPGLPNAPDDAMDDVSRGNIRRLKELGNFWFEKYGKAVTELLLNVYNGPSLDRIDPKTGKPIAQD